MPLKKTREEKKKAEIYKECPPELVAKLEELYNDLEAAGVRRQVLDHLNEAYFQIDPDRAEKLG